MKGIMDKLGVPSYLDWLIEGYVFGRSFWHEANVEPKKYGSCLLRFLIGIPAKDVKLYESAINS